MEARDMGEAQIPLFAKILLHVPMVVRSVENRE